MRRLALELGTGPASLYAHVENRRELDQLIVDRVADESLDPRPRPRALAGPGQGRHAAHPRDDAAPSWSRPGRDGDGPDRARRP